MEVYNRGGVILDALIKELNTKYFSDVNFHDEINCQARNGLIQLRRWLTAVFNYSVACKNIRLLQKESEDKDKEARSKREVISIIKARFLSSSFYPATYAYTTSFIS